MRRTKRGTRQGTLVLLPFPFSDLSGRKFRPALVVSKDVYNRRSDDAIMVPLTSVLKEAPFSIAVTTADLSEGTLLKSSVIKADKLFAIEQQLIQTEIGVISQGKLEEVKSSVFRLF